MTENQEQIERLQTRLDNLVKTQIDFQKEVSFIRAELDRLRGARPEIPMTPITAKLPIAPGPPPPVNEPPRSIPKWEPTPPPPRPEIPPPNFGVLSDEAN